MFEKEYAHLVKPLPTREGPGGPLPDQLIWMDSKDLGVSLNFAGGFHKTSGYWHTWAGAHTHPFDECLFFLGIDPTDISYLGAEVAIELGEEQEEHIIGESSVVVVPRGMPHGPLTTLQVDKPFGSYHILLAPEYKVTWMPKESKPPKTTGTKYSHLIKPLRSKGVIKPSEMGVGPGNADQLVWFFGKDLEGLEVNFTWGVYSKCGVWRREGGASKAHTHPFDEILVFVGLDPNDINYLGAEIEIDMGTEHERYIFNKPTVVICQKGFQHLPVTTRWVDKLYGCFVISLSPEYMANWID